MFNMHMRPDGQWHEGRFCHWCGKPTIRHSMRDCFGNAPLVAKLIDMNRFENFEEYTFDLLTRSTSDNEN